MRILLFLFCTALSFLPAAAGAQSPQYNARPYEQPELDALVAPVALYPDPVLSQVLAAAVTPEQIAEAAQWTRMNRGMTGDDALRSVQNRAWQPAVKSLVAYPELLERMADSPQWTFDLGNAYLAQQGEVMATVQTLRQRAYASGYLRSDAQQTVQSYGQTVAVLPAVPNVYYVSYYDPLVVYGPSWRPAYRPVYWRPWAPRPVFVTNVVIAQHSGPPSPAARYQAASNAAHVARVQAANRRPDRAARIQGNVVVQPYHRVPESQRQPIVQSRVAPALAQNHAIRQPLHQQQPRQQRPEHGQNPGNGRAQQRSNPRS